MKVVYLIDQDIKQGKTTGIITKVKGQVSGWGELGTSVRVISLYSFKVYNEKLELLDDSKSFRIKKHGRFYTLFRMFYSTLKLSKYLRKNSDFDLIYTRQRPWMPFFSSVLKRKPTVIEINAFDESEYKVISNLMYRVNHLTRNMFYPLARGFLGVTKELAVGYEEEFFKPSCAIGNGIDTERFEVLYPDNKRPKICFIGSPGFLWHGFDKVLYLANTLKNIDFHIVGMDGENSENIIFHGYLPLEKAKVIVGSCDVGLCSLSLYINSLTESTPLKSRQYLAQGLPIIYAYNDSDLSGKENFALKIPNSEDNVSSSIDAIQKFVLEAHNSEKLRVEARKFAENVLDVRVKESRRIMFFKSILNNS